MDIRNSGQGADWDRRGWMLEFTTHIRTPHYTRGRSKQQAQEVEEILARDIVWAGVVAQELSSRHTRNKKEK